MEPDRATPEAEELDALRRALPDIDGKLASIRAQSGALYDQLRALERERTAVSAVRADAVADGGNTETIATADAQLRALDERRKRLEEEKAGVDDGRGVLVRRSVQARGRIAALEVAQAQQALAAARQRSQTLVDALDREIRRFARAIVLPTLKTLGEVHEEIDDRWLELHRLPDAPSDRTDPRPVVELPLSGDLRVIVEAIHAHATDSGPGALAERAHRARMDVLRDGMTSGMRQSSRTHYPPGVQVLATPSGTDG